MGNPDGRALNPGINLRKHPALAASDCLAGRRNYCVAPGGITSFSTTGTGNGPSSSTKS
jgi:hypothetical protein